MDLLSGYERKGNKIVKRSNTPTATRSPRWILSSYDVPSSSLSDARKKKKQNRKYTVELELKFHEAVEPS